MIRNLHETLFTNDDILFFDEDFSNVTFFANEMGILSVDLDKINLMMLIFMKMVLKLLFMSDFKQRDVDR